MIDSLLQWFIGLSAVLVVSASPALALLILEPPKPDSVALVIAPPWGDGSAAIAARAGTAEAFPVRAPFGTFVIVKRHHDLEQLYNEGAWFVTNGEWLLELCLSQPGTIKR